VDVSSDERPQLDMSRTIRIHTGFAPDNLFEEVQGAVAGGEVEFVDLLGQASGTANPDMHLANLIMDEIYPAHWPIRKLYPVSELDVADEVAQMRERRRLRGVGSSKPWPKSTSPLTTAALFASVLGAGIRLPRL